MTDLADLFASKLIARPDVKDVQHSDGSYSPDRRPWTRAELEAHLRGTHTFGHYLLNTDDTCKIFCLDVDLRSVRKHGDEEVPDGWLPITGLTETEVPRDFVDDNPRA